MDGRQGKQQGVRREREGSKRTLQVKKGREKGKRRVKIRH
jgi:hypothetical protein